MREAIRVAAFLLIFGAMIASCGNAGGAPNFTLLDDHGRPWSLAQQRGKVVLLTFGFTRCADTCPATIAKLARITRTLPGGTQHAEVAFVTIDPARDSVPVMHRFIARFAEPGNGELVGLTGTPAEIARVKTLYQIWSQPTPHDIAHTAVIFLIGPDGRTRSLRNDDDSQESLSRAVAAILPSL